MSVFGINQRIADRLLEEGRIGPEDHRAVVARANRSRARVEDVLVENRFLAEADLLRFVATVHGTRFVSSEKLSKAVIDPRVLARVPLATAELHGVVPVLYDEGAGVLTVATADPDNDVALKEVRLGARVRDVRPLVARPAAVRAAIAQFYRNDPRPFQDVLHPVGDFNFQGVDPFSRGRTGQSLPEPITDVAPPSPPAPPAPAPAPPPQPAAPPPAPPAGPPRRATAPKPPEPADDLVLEMTDVTPVLAPPPKPAPPKPPPPPVKPPPPPAAVTAAVAAPPPAPAAPAAPSWAEATELVHVLVNLLENNRQDLRGHSATVARVTRKLCERIGVADQVKQAFVLAAYLHDLGKSGGTYHLTALNVADYSGHKVAAQKTFEMPVHLMESVGLPNETKTALTKMYERFDGKGFPEGVSGKDIPLGARILSVVDTYADLTQNPRNPYRKTLRPLEACDVLAQYRGTIFDPNIVDLFRHSMTGEDLKARLLADRHQVLIVDPDPEETTVLELRLVEHGFEVRIARSTQVAVQDLENRDVSVVICEVDVESPDAGLALKQQATAAPWGRDLVWIFLTGRTDRALAQKAFDLGTDDFVTKPTSADLLAAKIRTLIERKLSQKTNRGVSGSLAEMSLPDMVQILFHGRKTCALRLQSPQGAGEIHFLEGMIVHATFGSGAGEDAFYKLLKITEGSFRLDPTFKPKEQTIQAPPEALLLEGMRRLDEGLVG